MAAGRSGFVVGAGDAAGGAGEGDIGDRLAASEGGKGFLEQREGLRAGRGGLLSGERKRDGKYETNEKKGPRSGHEHLRLSGRGGSEYKNFPTDFNRGNT